jgi:hypothetical protein
MVSIEPLVDFEMSARAGVLCAASLPARAA